MKIAIDSGPLTGGHKVRGIGAHTSELLRALRMPGVDFSKADLSKFDVLHYTSFHPFFVSLPWRKPKNIKIVLTIHDLIPLIYPKHYPGGIKGNLRFLVQKLLIKKNVDAIITISETSKKDICRFLKVKPEKVNVIYLAPRKVFRRIADSEKRIVGEKYNLPNEFVLYVGDVNYNKNIPNLIKACRIAKTSLVICGKQAFDIETVGINDLSSLKGPKDWIRYLFGKPHPELAHYRELCGEFRENKKVLRLGYVPDEELVSIFSLASVYCQPSFYEGFGLPVLEAFACGTPVVASKTQALVEIVEDGALLADPYKPEEIAAQIVKVIEDEMIRKQLIKKGFTIAEKYSWEKTAKETLEMYEKV